MSNHEHQHHDNRGEHFVNDLVNMAIAARRVPDLEAQIANLQTANGANEHAVIELNKRLMEAHEAHESTKVKLSEVIRERDDASFRELEAQDKVDALRRAIGDSMATLGEALKAIEPPKEPEAKPDYSGKWLMDVEGWQHISLSQWQDFGGDVSKFGTRFGHSESGAFVDRGNEVPSASPTPAPSASTTEAASSDHGPFGPSEPPSSEPFPMWPRDDRGRFTSNYDPPGGPSYPGVESPAQVASAPQSAESSDAATQEDKHTEGAPFSDLYPSPSNAPSEGVSVSPNPSPADSASSASTSEPASAEQPVHGPYYDKRYYEVAGWVSRSDWLDGGGTSEDYDWRPSHGGFSQASQR